MDEEKKTDKELVEDPKIGVRGLMAQLEMMRRLKNSMHFSGWVMIVLTVILVIFTGILIWQGFNKFIWQ